MHLFDIGKCCETSHITQTGLFLHMFLVVQHSSLMKQPIKTSICPSFSFIYYIYSSTTTHSFWNTSRIPVFEGWHFFTSRRPDFEGVFHFRHFKNPQVLLLKAIFHHQYGGFVPSTPKVAGSIDLGGEKLLFWDI